MIADHLRTCHQLCSTEYLPFLVSVNCVWSRDFSVLLKLPSSGSSLYARIFGFLCVCVEFATEYLRFFVSVICVWF